MKKASFFAIFALLTAYSFAANPQSRSIFIEGTAEYMPHMAFFMEAFSAEASAMSINVSDTKEGAGFTFNFHVQRHSDERDPSISYMILISLIDNETDAELVSFGWAFARHQDMQEHIPFLFYTATALIPGLVVDEVMMIAMPPDNRWQNMRLYLRTSIDYPIVFYSLQPTGLKGGQGAFGPDPDYPEQLQHLDHIIMPRPGLTLGLELVVFNFLSLEFNFHGNLGDTRTYEFINFSAGGRLNLIFRTRNYMIQPYGIFLWHLNSSSEFYEFPQFSAGGGIQIATRGSRSGAFFIDVNFLISPGDVFIHNPYTGLTPYPRLIHYNRFVFGLGIGYKFGFFERRRR